MEPTLHRAADIYKHPLMQCFKEENEHPNGEPIDKENKMVLRAINQLYVSSGKRGKPSSSSKDTKYRGRIAGPIPEVLRKENGISQYHFPLLIIALSKSAQVLVWMNREKLNEMTEAQFVDEFFHNQVIRFYLEGAPDIVVNTAYKICMKTLIDFCLLNSKMQIINHIKTHGKLPC